jgi:hypothetical protein
MERSALRWRPFLVLPSVGGLGSVPVGIGGSGGALIDGAFVGEAVGGQCYILLTQKR